MGTESAFPCLFPLCDNARHAKCDPTRCFGLCAELKRCLPNADGSKECLSSSLDDIVAILRPSGIHQYVSG